MEVVCLDSSVLIEYYRRKDKTKTFFLKLAGQYQFAITVANNLKLATLNARHFQDMPGLQLIRP